MSEILATLNKAQKKAVLHDEGPLVIIAGAGSGKTKTITHKIAHIINEKKANAHEILAVTFTNKAADEMKERVTNLVPKISSSVWISTYHSLCAKILRQDIEMIGFKNGFNIIDSIDQRQILKRGYRKFDLSYKSISYNSVIEFISKCKNNQISPQDILEDAEKDVDKMMGKLYEFYLNETSRTNSLDFDDLLIFAHKLLKNNESAAKKWNDKFKYILVDEFQDTSITQYEIIKIIAKDKKIIVVGDPDQTIYTWRHADSNLILDFNKSMKNTSVVLLEQNYRSTKNILEAANSLIENNKNRVKKVLFTNKEKGSDITYHHAFSEDAEARWVADQIFNLSKEKTRLRDIVILYRANYLTHALEKALINKNVNYIIYGSVKFYQREEIKDVIAFLKVINDGDPISLRRVINVPPRKIGPSSQDNLFTFLEGKGNNFFELMIKYFDALPLKQTAHENLGKFINLVRKYSSALRTNKISLVIEKFLIEISYFDKWNNIEAPSRKDNVNNFVTSIKEWEKLNSDKKLGELLEEIALYSEQEQEDRDKNNYVSLMTVHSAKGLEFDNVFVYGFSEEVFPSKRAINEGGDDALEEERRLAYVALTRARDKLYISSSKGFAIDYKTYKQPSRFIGEMGLDPNAFSKTFIAPKSFEQNYNDDNDFLEGEEIEHEKFGVGVVVSVQGDIVEISFKSPHGLKTMMKKHKSLRRVR